LRRLSVLPAVLTVAALAYTNSAAAAAAPEAPLAPVNTSLLQGNPAAPTSIDDVLLVPSASAGQKGAAFEWADKANTHAYVLWDKFFAAAQYSQASSATAAQTIASFGYMSPRLGAGLSLAYRDNTVEGTYVGGDTGNTTTYSQLSQIKLFASMSMPSMDIYGSLGWVKPTDNTYDNNQSKYNDRDDSVALMVGARHAPAIGAEGLAWNANGTLGFHYDRYSVNDGSTFKETIWIAQLYGQLGYAFFVDGINFLPGLDAYFNYANGLSHPDYSLVFGVAPSLAITVPLFEHWTLAGGAKYNVEQTLVDSYPGSHSTFNDKGLIANTVGQFGLRYARDRWAAEAGVSNGFLNRGPYFVSGTTGDLLYSLGFTVNLK